MANRKLVIYFHIIWSTQDNLPLITPDIERPIYRCIVSQIQKMDCEVIAINGVHDHIHLVVKLRSTVPLAKLIKQVKGISSKFINDQLNFNGRFRWNAGYGAFTVSRWDLPMIIQYVKKQKTHHADGFILDDLE